MKSSLIKITVLSVIAIFFSDSARAQNTREVYQGNFSGNPCEVTLMWADASGTGGVVGRIKTGSGVEITFIGQSPRSGYLEIDVQGRVDALQKQVSGNTTSWSGKLLTFSRVEAAAAPAGGAPEKRYAGFFRGNACTAALTRTTADGTVDVSGTLTFQSGAVLRISGAETRPGFLEISVETDESINHKLNLTDVGGKSAWVGDYLSLTEIAAPGLTQQLSGGKAPAPGSSALTPLGGGMPPKPPFPGTGVAPLGGGLPPKSPKSPFAATGAPAMPPSSGGLNPGVPPGGGLTTASAPAEDLQITPLVWPVGKWPEGMAHDGNFLWVAESGQRTLVQINPSSGAVITRVNSGRLPVGMATNPLTGDVFAEVATDQTLVKFSRGAKGGKFASLPDYPGGIAADDSAVWVLMWIDGSNAQGQVIRFDQGSGAASKSELLGDAVSNIGKAGNSLWVNQAKLDTTHLNLLDPATAQRKQTITLKGFFPSLSASENSVYMAGGNWDVDGMVVRVDPVTLQETARRSLPGEFIYRLTANNDYVIAAGAKGTLWILSAQDLTVQRTIHLNWGPFRPASLLIDGDILYLTAHEGSGENGSVLVVNDWAPAGHP